MKNILTSISAFSLWGVLFAFVPAKADTIDFSQFGPIAPISFGTPLSSPLKGTTTDGVGVTLISSTGSFYVLQEGPYWGGSFSAGAGAVVLFNVGSEGFDTLDFATGISSLTLAAEPRSAGTYIETAYAFSGTTLVDVVSATVGDPFCCNVSTATILTVKGMDITSVLFNTTNDSAGFGLDGSELATQVPEPASIVLLGTGLVGIGLIRRRRH